MEVSYKQTTYEKAHTIYETCCNLGATPNYKTKLVHFDHQREDIKIKRKIAAENA
jgi:hypothetical protein